MNVQQAERIARHQLRQIARDMPDVMIQGLINCGGFIGLWLMKALRDEWATRHPDSKPDSAST